MAYNVYGGGYIPRLSGLDKLKMDLWPYRNALLYVHSLVTWERSYSPVVLFVAVSGFYWFLDQLNLSFITLCAMLMIGSLMFKHVKSLWMRHPCNMRWDTVSEAKYVGICFKLNDIHVNLVEIWAQVQNPATKCGLCAMLLFCLALAWIGAVVNNSLICYLITIGLVMLPGMRNRMRNKPLKSHIM